MLRSDETKIWSDETKILNPMPIVIVYSEAWQLNILLWVCFSSAGTGALSQCGGNASQSMLAQNCLASARKQIMSGKVY